MRGVHGVDEIRTAENELMARLPEGALMARAATGLAVECARLLGPVYGARVVLLVGAGNNGGDALYAGAWLARRGVRATALLLAPDKAHPGGLAAFRAAGGRTADPTPAALAGADLVLDGIVGIGGTGGLRDEAVPLAQAARDALTVAVDVPSGVDADTGAVEGETVHADVTVTFGALKPGLVVGTGAERAGELRLVDIGLAATLPAASTHVFEAADVAALLPTPGAADNKYTRGVLGVAAGSSAYPGAGVLCTGSAINGGAGMIRYVGTAADAIRAQYPEVVVQEGAAPDDLHVQAWVAGPGMGTDDAAHDLLAAVLATGEPAVVDADGITLVGSSPGLVRDRDAPTVLTPHDGEFARIADGPSGDRLASVRAAARDLDAVVLLKGNATVIAAPDGRAWVNRTGTPWLGTAGSGDVLSGLIGSLLAAGLEAPLAAAVGAYVHGVAGQLAAQGGPPSSLDVLHAVRPALREIGRG
ncbi:yjeF C-terminal region, hydroxyethylthiazole kinase-related/yjeF N-terminal region [Jatrophihabitans endophyticus]|uniref:Bifunctional NAD(P)H-hydrate repair enzyme n=1 Tax=Jatrophihabitans endophyticus TaxID=1206085 RepID=A0A1M5GHA7_9ACTN|nr:NAD(P)H-hydrate dehydratase [Jatrophihabitans endophyticus]SHG03076.1 yjeF C-terminal region, hydroxyethylthiazole kinase-related/yjeF N-terminal region [Jatrophihabitans endophyticus]